MTEKPPLVTDIELKAILRDHFRRSLDDALLRGALPESVAKTVDESPEQVVELLVRQIAPGAIKRLNAQSTGQPEETPVAEVLSQKDLMLLLRIFASLQVVRSHYGDVDLDGALLFCVRGRKMLKTERYQDAKRLFQQALTIKEVKAAWQGLAEAQEQLGEHDGAAESLRRAAAL